MQKYLLESLVLLESLLLRAVMNWSGVCYEAESNPLSEMEQSSLERLAVNRGLAPESTAAAALMLDADTFLTQFRELYLLTTLVGVRNGLLKVGEYLNCDLTTPGFAKAIALLKDKVIFDPFDSIS